MNTLAKVLRYILIVDGSIFLISLVASLMISDRIISMNFAYINLISMIVFPISLFAYILIKDILRNSTQWTKLIFYIGISIAFLALLFVKYKNYLNGYIVVIPGIAAILALIVTTISDFKSKKRLAYAWSYLSLILLITYLIANYF